MGHSLVLVALGHQPATLVVTHGRLVNVYSGEVMASQNIAILDDRIAYVGPSDRMVGSQTQVIDAQSAYLLPGFIDPHAHLDFPANPLAYGAHLLATGTTTVMADPHDLTGALGAAGLDLLIAVTRRLPLKFHFTVPVSSPPFPDIEGPEALSTAEIAAFLRRPEILGLSEVTPWVRLTEADPALVRHFNLARGVGKSVEGHTTGASGDKLIALAASGLTSCHEMINASEARERLRLGLHVMLRHGSIRSDLEPLLGLLLDPEVDTSRVMLTPDWMSPADILEHGYMDYLVATAIALGASPLTAIRLATLNPATYLRLDREVGGLAPGRRADILAVDDLRRPTPHLVIADGQVVAREGRLVTDWPSFPLEQGTAIPWPAHRRLPADLSADDFRVTAPLSEGTCTVPAIAIANKTITRRQDVTLPVQDGQVLLDPAQDVVKMSLWRGPGFVTVFLVGLGARPGGLASSIAHEHHRPVVFGTREADMALALSRVRDMGGGQVLVQGGEVVAEVQLSIGGMMAAGSLQETATQIERVNAHLRQSGSALEDPLFTLGFLTFAALPWIRLTPKGLLDVRRREIIWP